MVETCLMEVVGSYGVRWSQRGWFKIRVDSGADEVHRGSYGVEFRTEYWMLVMVVMGSYGVRWGQRGWLKILVDSGAYRVHRGSYWLEF